MPRRLSNQAYPSWMGLVPEKNGGLSQKGHGLKAIPCAHLESWSQFAIDTKVSDNFFLPSKI